MSGLFKWFKKNVNDNRSGLNIKCSCGVWSNDVPLKSIEYDTQAPFATTECGSCGQYTEWFIGAPVWIKRTNIKES